jgi:hypothetical protein
MADDDDRNEEVASSDTVTEVTSKSWLQRLGESVGGVVVGFILIAGSGFLLFWNEGRAIQTARSLTEGAGLVLSVSADRVDAANDGKLVHVSGALAASGPAVDGDFTVRSSGIRLVRHVEMYQWKEETQSETRKKLGGGEETVTTYKYTRDWVDRPIDSGKFKERAGHANPAMAYQQRTVVAPQPKVGAFSVPESLLRNFGEERPLAATDEQAKALERRLNRPVAAVDGALYVGRDPSQPAIGDLRIKFGEVSMGPASVIGRQAASSFEPYQTKAGGTVQLIAAGRVPAADMFKAAQDENRLITWLIRGGGVLLMFIGFGLILKPLSVLADVIPILGDIVGAGASIIALLCTAVVAPVVIAIGWLWYRPVVAIGVLVVGGAVAYGAVRLGRQRAARKAALKPA